LEDNCWLSHNYVAIAVVKISKHKGFRSAARLHVEREELLQEMRQESKMARRIIARNATQESTMATAQMSADQFQAFMDSFTAVPC